MMRRPIVAPLMFASLLLTCGAVSAASGVPVFSDATPGSGIDSRNLCGAEPGDKGWLTEHMGAGAAWLDYDGDGNLDLYVVNGSAYDRKPGQGEPNRLFRGDGKGRFTDVTAQAGVGDKGWGYGVSVGDFDNDGHPDLFVANIEENVLYRNRGDGTFADVTAKAGIRGAVWSSSSAFFDMEGDGDLDLYVGNYMVGDPDKVPRRGTPEAMIGVCTYKGVPVACGPMGQVPLQDVLYRNNGDATFTDVTREAGLWLEKPRFALGVVVADFDNDGDPDVYVANDSVRNSLWDNRGDGTFVDVGLQRLAALNADGRPQAGMGTNVGDYDGDGWLDIVVTNFSHDLNTVYHSLGGKFFMDDTLRVGLGVTHLNLSWGVGFHDFDNDGDEDLFVANGHIYAEVDGYEIGTAFRQNNHMFVNDGGVFRDASASAGPAFTVKRSYRAATFGDYDNDGDQDVFVTTLNDHAMLLRNDTPSKGHYLMLRLVGTRSNRDAVGARVRIDAGGVTRIRERKGGGSYLSAEDTRLHFGLGAATRADRVEIRWPSGQVDVLENVAADRLITVEEGKP